MLSVHLPCAEQPTTCPHSESMDLVHIIHITIISCSYELSKFYKIYCPNDSRITIVNIMKV